MTRHLTALLIAGSLAGCGVPRPDADLCIVNAPNLNRKCYNLKRDYDDDGSLKPGAVPTYRANATVQDLNKALLIDSPFDAEHPNPTHFEDGIARMKAWVKELREASQGAKPKPE